MGRGTQKLVARPIGPGGQYLVRTDESVQFTLEQTAQVLAYTCPVVPVRWGVVTVKTALRDAARAYLTLDKEGGDAAAIVLQELARAAAARERRRRLAPSYAPAPAGGVEQLAAEYQSRLVASGTFERAATVGEPGDRRIRVLVPRYHTLNQAAALLAAEVGSVPLRAGWKTAHHGLIDATQARRWPVDPDAEHVEGWRELLRRVGPFAEI